jgi:hypothetical protein
MTTELEGRITRGVMAAQMARTARDLHGPLADAATVNPEYTRGQVELICVAAGLGTDDYRDDVEAFITGKTTDEEFGMMLARAVFS